jgi:hypothetical protein
VLPVAPGAHLALYLRLLLQHLLLVLLLPSCQHLLHPSLLLPPALADMDQRERDPIYRAGGGNLQKKAFKVNCAQQLCMNCSFNILFAEINLTIKNILAAFLNNFRRYFYTSYLGFYVMMKSDI